MGIKVKAIERNVAFEKGKQLHLDKANRDIAMLVNLCSKEDYGIKVYYWKGPCTSSRSLKRRCV